MKKYSSIGDWRGRKRREKIRMRGVKKKEKTNINLTILLTKTAVVTAQMIGTQAIDV